MWPVTGCSSMPRTIPSLQVGGSRISLQPHTPGCQAPALKPRCLAPPILPHPAVRLPLRLPHPGVCLPLCLPHPAIDRAIGKDGFRVVMLLRLSPLLPLAASNYLCESRGLFLCQGRLRAATRIGWAPTGAVVLTYKRRLFLPSVYASRRADQRGSGLVRARQLAGHAPRWEAGRARGCTSSSACRA